MDKKIEQLKSWVINKIKQEYPDDVALLIGIENHSVNGDGHGECFDYFIPATERGYELSQTFIVDGVGHGLYPRSWERVIATAMFEDRPQLCIGRAKILYSRSKEDEDKFFQIQKQFEYNLKNKQFMYERGLEKIEVAMQLFSSLIFQEKLSQIRMTTGYILNYLSMAIAYLNGTYLDQFDSEKLLGMEYMPEKFILHSKLMFRAIRKDEYVKIAYELLNETRELFKSCKQNKKEDSEKYKSSLINYFELADWYHELALTFRRLRYYCDISDIEKVYIEGCYLQSELDIVHMEFDLNEMDLLSEFHPECLEQIKIRSNQIEQYIISEIIRNGAGLKRYDTIDEFLKSN